MSTNKYIVNTIKELIIWLVYPYKMATMLGIVNAYIKNGLEPYHIALEPLQATRAKMILANKQAVSRVTPNNLYGSKKGVKTIKKDNIFALDSFISSSILFLIHTKKRLIDMTSSLVTLERDESSYKKNSLALYMCTFY